MRGELTMLTHHLLIVAGAAVLALAVLIDLFRGTNRW